MEQKTKKNFSGKVTIWMILASGVALQVNAQDGVTGINSATDNMKAYFPAGISLMYAIGGVLGLVGAVKVYQKWSHGDQDTSKVAASWFGSCIFLVVVATVLKSFFAL